MDQDHVSMAELGFKVALERTVVLVKEDAQFWKRLAKVIDGLDGFVLFALNEIRERPGAEFFMAADFVPHAPEVAR